MRKCPLLIAVILTAVLQATPTLAQSPTNLTALQGLVPTSALANTAAGKAALAANLAVTAAVQDGSAKQPLLLPFPEQQQQALRDAYITDGNAYELADGLGTALSHAYWSLVTFQSPNDGKTSSFTSLSPAIALALCQAIAVISRRGATARSHRAHVHRSRRNFRLVPLGRR
jgi:hypothetical protein